MGFFGQNKKRKYDPELIIKSSSYVISKHVSPVIAQGEVQKLRDQASEYAKENFGADIPASAFLNLIKMTDFKDSDIRSRIVKHYKEDRSIERTASYFRTSAQTVKKILKEYGLSITTGLQTAVFVLIFNAFAHSEVIEDSVKSSRELLDYGALGIFCVFLMGTLGYFIKTHRDERKSLHKCHAEERKCWKDTTEKQFAESAELSRKVVEVTSEIKGMINAKNSNL